MQGTKYTVTKTLIYSVRAEVRRQNENVPLLDLNWELVHWATQILLCLCMSAGDCKAPLVLAGVIDKL